jgi:hypothetical protein
MRCTTDTLVLRLLIGIVRYVQIRRLPWQRQQLRLRACLSTLLQTSSQRRKDREAEVAQEDSGIVASIN